MGGEETRQRILEAAERLFAEQGFDGTGVDAIASSAGVTKSLIYHHFGNKHRLLTCLFEKILTELNRLKRPDIPLLDESPDSESAKAHFREEIALMDKQRYVFTSLLMESLKAGGAEHLFQVAELVMTQHVGDPIPAEQVRSERYQGRLVFEFFTGLIPLIMFVALRHQWCRHYGTSEEALLRRFLDAFERTHVNVGPAAE